MSGACTSYVSAARELVRGFRCPRPGGEAAAVFCCGFRDHKYCCDDPHSFFPYEHSYVWRLSIGALVGLSIAAVVLLAFIVTACVLCYLFINSKPHTKLDPGLSLHGLAPAFGPGRDPGDPGSNPTSGSRCMEPASPSACVSASLSLSVTIINK
uniref:Shisa like 2A n=1 Tax=Canis lupus familiaris TaxID=9615 RepID=A0A8C0QP65_CANLF